MLKHTVLQGNTTVDTVALGSEQRGGGRRTCEGRPLAARFARPCPSSICRLCAAAGDRFSSAFLPPTRGPSAMMHCNVLALAL